MKIFICALFLVPSIVLAGTHVSGGGHTVVCTDPVTGSVGSEELLDVFEARNLLGGNPVVPADGFYTDANARVLEIGREFINRLNTRSPLRAAVYRQLLDGFFRRLAVFTDYDLTFIDDADSDIIGDDCKVQQIAIQRDRIYWLDPIFIINRKLWDGLAHLGQRAALFLHEIAYREFRNYGHTDSQAARRFVGAVLTQSIQSTNYGQRDFLRDLFRSGVPETDLGGLWLRLWDFKERDPFLHIAFYSEITGMFGSVRHVSARLVANTPLDKDFCDDVVPKPRIYTAHNRVFELKVNDSQADSVGVEVDFTADGQLSALVIKDASEGSLLLLDTTGQWVPMKRLRWNAEGALESGL